MGGCRARDRFVARLVFVVVYVLFLIAGKSASAAPDPLLASAPEFDLTDPVLVAKADELGHDPARIFAFVRDEIGYEVYRGSLRGARGALWSKAGNALDQSSLLIALLRISGIPAQYARGTLADDDAKRLIGSMFDPTLMAQAIGYIPPDQPRADPVNDPALIAEARDHWWVKLGDGTALDPSFLGQSFGQTRTGAASMSAAPPDGERQTVTLRLVVYNQNPFSPQEETSTPLEHTFFTPELQGKHVYLSHFTDTQEVTGLIGIGQVTFKYTPYFKIYDLAQPSLDPEVVAGEPYQEFAHTLFPLANQIVSHIDLEADIAVPGREVEQVSRTVRERPPVTGAAGGQPAAPLLDSLFQVGVTADASGAPLDLFASLANKAGQAAEEVEGRAASAKMLADKDPNEIAGKDIVEANHFFSIGGTLQSTIGNTLASILSSTLAELSRNIAAQNLVYAISDTPRLTFLTIDGGKSPQGDLVYELDLVKDWRRILSYPEQDTRAPNYYNMIRGVTESAVETALGEQFSTDPQISVSAFKALSNAVSGGIALRIVRNQDEAEQLIDKLSIQPLGAKSIRDAIANGETIIMPTSRVQIAGSLVIAWYEVRKDGTWVGVTEDGRYGLVDTLKNYAAVVGTTAYLATLKLGEAILALLNVSGQVIARIARPTIEIVKNCKTVQQCVQFVNYLASLPQVVSAIQTGTQLVKKFTAGEPFRFDMFSDGRLPSQGGPDPDVGTIFYRGTDVQLASLMLPRSTQMVAVQRDLIVVSSMDFEAWRPWGRLPSALTVAFGDAPTAGDYKFEWEIGDPAWEVLAGRDTATLKEGGTAYLSVFLRPKDENFIPPAGTPVSLKVTARGPNGAVVGQPVAYVYTVPELNAVRLDTAAAQPIPLAPDQPETVPVTITNAGNVAQTVTLAAQLPAGVTASGLGAPLTLAPGASATRQMTLTGTGLAANASLTATVTAHFGAESALSHELRLGLRALDANAYAAATAAGAAGTVGRPQMAGTLESIATTMAALGTTPGDRNQRSRLVGLIDTLVSQVDAAILPQRIADLQTARDELAAADEAALAEALTDLSMTLDGLRETLAGLSDLRSVFEASLYPNTREAQPAQPAVFDLVLKNKGTETTTYVVGLEPLPTGVTGSLSASRVTLAPGESTDLGARAAVSLTLKADSSALGGYGLAVNVMAEGKPATKQLVTGSLVARAEFVRVVAVDASPGAVKPGDPVTIRAKVLNAVNRSRDARAGFQVVGSNGNVVFTSTPVAAPLSIAATLSEVNLGTLPTTGLANGSYGVRVTLTDVGGTPIPGGTGEGRLQVGLPVSAALTATPQVQPAGDGVVEAKLAIESRIELPPPAITLLSQTDTEASATSLAVRDGLAYVCGTENVTILNVSNPGQPEVIGTFADEQIVGASISKCQIVDDHLIVFWQVGINAPRIEILVYDLRDATSPALIGQTSSPIRFLNSIFFKNRLGFATASGYRVFFGAAILGEFGNLVSVDFQDFLEPTVLDVLFDAPEEPLDGEFIINTGTEIDDRTIYAASATSTGSHFGFGVGRLLVVDTSTPSDLKIARELQVPKTVRLTGIGVQGKRGLLAGSTGYLGVQSGSIYTVGQIVLQALDATDPRNPTLIGSPLALPNSTGAYTSAINPLGSGFFGVSGVEVDGKPVLLIVDANDPAKLSYTTIEVPARIDESQVIGNLLYTPSAAGLGIFDIGDLVGARYQARVDIPKGAGVAVAAGSFNIPPTDVLVSDQADTLVWDRSLTTTRNPETLSWQMNVEDLKPGELRPVLLGGRVGFTTPDGDTGELPLAPVGITGERILALSPDTRTVSAGSTTSYLASLTNPTAAPLVVQLTQTGLPADWVHFPAQVTIPASGLLNVPLMVAVPAGGGAQELGFVVTATTPFGPDTAQGALIVQAGDGVAPGSGVDLAGNTLGVALADISGAALVAGQGTSATFRLRITNAGTVADTYQLVASLPAGFTATFSEPQPAVPPGFSGAREVLMTVRATEGTAAGNYPFDVVAKSTTNPQVTDRITVGLGVDAQGVALTLTPSEAAAGSGFQLRVSNTGRDRETYALALAGPAALHAKLTSTSVILDPGHATTVDITTETIRQAFPGGLPLIATATAQSNQSVRAEARARVTIAATAAVATAFDPAEHVLEGPGQTEFLLLVDNRGNVEDAYSATIIGTTGPVEAELVGIDGAPTAEVPLFRLPGLMTAALPLRTRLLTGGTGTVTVQVTSRTNPGVSSSAVALVRAEGGQSENKPPVCRAGDDQVVLPGTTVTVDGTRSFDPDNGPAPLSYAWRFSRVPPGSALTEASLSTANAAQTSFQPDAPGVYIARLNCADGEATKTDASCIAVGGVRLELAGTYKTYRFNEGASTRLAYAPFHHHLFVVNQATNSVDAIDLSDPTNLRPAPRVRRPIDVSAHGHPTDVAVRGGVVAVAVAPAERAEPGKVLFYDTNGQFLKEQVVGASPAALEFTPDGRLLVINSGEKSGTVDPEGSLSVIDLRSGIDNLSVSTIGFEDLDRVTLTAKGVRFVDPAATAAQDLEPVAAAISKDGKTAWVTLPTNNAIAIVDLDARSIRDVVAAGTKNHQTQGQGLDASDRDRLINIRSWHLQGLYQPESIEGLRSSGQHYQYVLTANPGRDRGESARVADLLLDPTAFPNAAALQNNRNLGRLQVSSIDGDSDGDGDYDQLVAYGSRSLSVWSPDGQLVWDSGDKIEKTLQREIPADFNAESTSNRSFDRSSSEHGPEPGSIATGWIDHRLYAFAALRSTGSILAYDVSVPNRPCFLQHVINRDFSIADAEQGVLTGAVGDLGPENLLFIPAQEAPTGVPLLAVANAVSGTTTVYYLRPLQ